MGGDEEEEEVLGSGQSASTNNSLPPPVDKTILKLNHLDVHADDAGSHASLASGKKKKRGGQRAVGPDKSGRGLRQFSMKVCEKVESRGRTTYNERLFAMRRYGGGMLYAALPLHMQRGCFRIQTHDQQVTKAQLYRICKMSIVDLLLGVNICQQQYDEKNIRRRVYDALNVLMAMDIISKDKKEIQWRGLPRTTVNDIEELKTERLGLRNRIEKKTAYLQELEEQLLFANCLYYHVKFIGLQNLIQRNEQLYSSGNPPSGGVSLPFILVQTRPHATVEVEISEDMQLVHFDFNSTPFELHDDNYVLKAMKFGERPQDDNMTHNLTDGGEVSSMSGLCQPQAPTNLNVSNRPPTSPPLPGILKARVKQEH
ncbi:Transcription factor-like protein DPB [Glycine soja]